MVYRVYIGGSARLVVGAISYILQGLVNGSRCFIRCCKNCRLECKSEYFGLTETGSMCF